MNSFSSTTQTLASPFRHSRPAVVRTSPLQAFDETEALTLLQARFALRGSDPGHATGRSLSLAIVSADGQTLRVLRGRLMRSPIGGKLHLLDEDGVPLAAGIDEHQVIGWCAEETHFLEASAIKAMRKLQAEIDEHFMMGFAAAIDAMHADIHPSWQSLVHTAKAQRQHQLTA